MKTLYFLEGPHFAGQRLFPVPMSGLLSNTQKWVVQGDTHAEKASDFIEKGHLGGEQEDKGSQEGCSATWLGLRFMVMELASRLSLANYSGSGSFLVVHTLLSQDGFQQGDFWEISRTCGVSFWPFLNSSSWCWLVSSIPYQDFLW